MFKWIKNYFMPQYVSPIDQFLSNFDKSHPHPSLSQAKEQKQFQKIFKARDEATASDVLKA